MGVAPVIIHFTAWKQYVSVDGFEVFSGHRGTARELELEIGNAPTIKGPDKVGSILHQWMLEVYSYSISFTSISNCSSKFTNRFTHSLDQ